MTYSFPNISVQESIVGPIPSEASWRNIIGVAGQFRKGPKGAYRISSRQDFLIFGEDNSPGALFVRQAMLQGATDFVISRAIPSSTRASSSIVFSSTIPTNEAQIGFEGNIQQFVGQTPSQTTGLTFTAGYIGSPIAFNTVGTELETKADNQISNELLFNDLAQVDFGIEEFLEVHSTVTTTNMVSIAVPAVASIPVVVPVRELSSNLDIGSMVYFEGSKLTLTVAAVRSTEATTLTGVITGAIAPQSKGNVVVLLSTNIPVRLIANNGVQVMLFEKTQIAFKNNLKPGRLVYSVNRAQVDFDSDPTARDNDYLEVISYAWDYDLNNYGVLVRGNVTVGSVQATYSVNLGESRENIYILSNTLVSNQPLLFNRPSGDTDTYNYLERKFSINSRNAVVDGFDFIPQIASNVYREHNFYFLINGSQRVRVVPSGIELRFKEYYATGRVAYLEGGIFTVPYARGSVSLGQAKNGIPLQIGKSASEILKELKSEIESNIVLNEFYEKLEISSTLLPYALNLQSKQKGEEANRLYYSITRTVSIGTPNDLVFNAPTTTLSNTNFSTPVNFRLVGGLNGATTANRIFYSETGQPLIRVEAISVGAYGNLVKVSIVPNIKGTFTINVEDEDAKSYMGRSLVESFNLNNRDVDLNSGLYRVTEGSNIIRVYYIPVENGRAGVLSEEELNQVPMRTAPPFGAVIPSLNIGSPLPSAAVANRGQTFLRNIYLEGGSDNQQNRPFVNTVSDEVMQEAVEALESSDIALLSIAGTYINDPKYPKSIEALVRQVNATSTYNGLRIGVLSAPPRLAMSQAETITSTYQSERLVVVVGHCSMASEPRSNNNISAVGFYCGQIAVKPPHYSPAAPVNAQGVLGIATVDVPSAPLYLDEITKARLEALVFDKGMGVFKFLNGLSTAIDPQKRYISVRRLLDQIISDLTRNLSWVRSQPNDIALRKKVATSCDAYLQSLVRIGAIYRFAPTVCSSSNNTMSNMAQGILNIRITITPVYPADFIRISLINDITENFTLQ